MNDTMAAIPQTDDERHARADREARDGGGVDRMSEIEARLDKATLEKVCDLRSHPAHDVAYFERGNDLHPLTPDDWAMLANAPNDLQYLIAEIKRLHEEKEKILNNAWALVGNLSGAKYD